MGLKSPTMSLYFITQFHVPIKIIFGSVNFCHKKPQSWDRFRYIKFPLELWEPWGLGLDIDKCIIGMPQSKDEWNTHTKEDTD